MALVERCPIASPATVRPTGCHLPLAIPSTEVPLFVRWEEHSSLPPTAWRNAFFVQVGANCGRNTPECAAGGDPVWPYVRSCGWRGIAIEPVRRTFHRLCENYAALGAASRVTPLRALIADKREDGLVVAQGEMSHVASTREAQTHRVRHNLTRGVERVPTLTLSDVWPNRTELARGHQTAAAPPLVLVIDAEGAEPRILARGDLPQPPPDFVLFEMVHLADTDRALIDANLRRQGYARRAALRHQDANALHSKKTHDWLYARARSRAE